MIKVGIIGASGYGGAELIRLLFNHPHIELVAINARSYIGQKLSDLYPNFQNIHSFVFEDEDSVIEKSDVIFAALPHGLSESIAKKVISNDKKFIDLGADFRLENEQEYATWYNTPFKEKELHNLSVYGLSEVNEKDIKDASIIANPGCYPTSVALGLYPLLQNFKVQPHIIVDSKSGTTGAGKELSTTTHFPRCNESFAPYKVASHRHTPEIEQTLSIMANDAITITFVPHLLPINRGIISTMYVRVSENICIEKLHNMYEETYKDKPFVRVLEIGKSADLKYVKYSNFCDISLHKDTRTNTIIIVSCIDNMVKGAAGQAIQNLNIMYGFAQDCGLQIVPPAF